MLATTTVELFDIGVLLLFISTVLGVNFSSNLGYILLTCLVGTITGVTMGTFIGIIVKKNEGVKVGNTNWFNYDHVIFSRNDV